MGKKHILSNIFKTKFGRSLFSQFILIFIFISVAIVTITFVSFSSEINNNIINDRQKHITTIGKAISQRIDETTNIAQNIASDPIFSIEPLSMYTSKTLTDSLAKYLIGNDFIDYLSFYRLTEPDKIYVSIGERNLNQFLQTTLAFNNYTEEEYIDLIKSTTQPQFIPLGIGEAESFFTYVYPLPQTSSNPQAFIIMNISEIKVKTSLEALITNNYGEISIYDNNKRHIYSINNLDHNYITEQLDKFSDEKETYTKIDGQKYVLQKLTFPVNKWELYSFVKLNNLISGLAYRQIIFIILLLSLICITIILMFIAIAHQYKPISNLVTEVTGTSEINKGKDERTILTDTFQTLKDDSKQKQIYENAYQEAEASNKAKSAFLSSLSHDIRTPMNAIIGFTTLALKNLDDKQYVKDCLEKASVASKYLLDILNNVLDMSRIESGRMTLNEEPIVLSDFIYGLKTILNQTIEKKRQKIFIDVVNITNENIIGDNVRLLQIFVNILTNAIKFTPEEGTISLILAQTQTDKPGYGNYIFTFTDTGIGMSPDFVEHVFDSFSRANNSTVNKIEGTGLGMTIVKNLVTLMGGTITCQSELNKGTTFTVKLSFKLANEFKEKGKWELIKLFANLPVLIIGEQNIIKNQINLFTKCELKVDTTNDLEEANQLIQNQIIKQNPYYLIIINQSEEITNNPYLLNKLNMINQHEDTSVIYINQNLINTNELELYKLGVNKIVQSPLFISTICNILTKLSDEYLQKTEIDITDLANKKILLVEDNEINREIARLMLQDTQIEITEAFNGQEAVDIFISKPVGYFDLILMDILMPVMDGYEATRIIRSLDRKDALTVPIYAMTANTFEDDVKKVKEIGMNGHLGKPYTQNDLLKVLKEQIK